MGITEIDHNETFGIMFQLGEDGTFIIPIDLSDIYFENMYRELSRIKRNNYSDNVNLVNYMASEKQEKHIQYDNLTAMPAEHFGMLNAEELFEESMNNPRFFNKMTKILIENYQKDTH